MTCRHEPVLCWSPLRLCGLCESLPVTVDNVHAWDSLAVVFSGVAPERQSRRYGMLLIQVVVVKRERLPSPCMIWTVFRNLCSNEIRCTLSMVMRPSLLRREMSTLRFFTLPPVLGRDNRALRNWMLVVCRFYLLMYKDLFRRALS